MLPIPMLAALPDPFSLEAFCHEIVAMRRSNKAGIFQSES